MWTAPATSMRGQAPTRPSSLFMSKLIGTTPVSGPTILSIGVQSRILKYHSHGSANTVSVIEPGCACQNPAAIPETAATYCLPLTA